jgi:hypothetical protein
MGWIETITKEGFQLAVKEAMRPDMDRIEDRLSQLSERLSRLEGAMEGNMRAYEANIRAMFAEFKVEVFRHLLDKPENGGQR